MDDSMTATKVGTYLTFHEEPNAHQLVTAADQARTKILATYPHLDPNSGILQQEESPEPGEYWYLYQLSTKETTHE
jgi:hypothetical protein